MISAMRGERDAILKGIAPLHNLGLEPAPLNSAKHDCATQAILTLPTHAAAKTFTKIFPSVIAGETGRHTYTEWDQVLMGAGAAHPLMNPYTMPANAECRRSYSKDMCARSLEILNRTVLVATHPLHTGEDVKDIIHNVGVAARVALDGMKPDEAEVRNVKPIEVQKFDLKVDA
jgi:hypothetical protein